MAESSAKEKKKEEGQAAGDAPTQSSKGGTEPTLALPAGTKPGAPEGVSAPPGTYLGIYELIEKIGQGGMGSVWKARHTKLDKLVAVKLLPPHLMTDAEAVSRFEREMKAVGKLEHAHIVRAMDAGQAEGVHYLVMEYIEGTDLSRIVKQRGKRSVQEACQMVRHAALGLAHAHEHGLVHRDIKPSNLLLSKKGLVKILDLGLARLASEKPAEEVSLTVHGETMGTPDYMAPEQWNSAHSAGPAADLYALGCTLFHLLTGKPPFAGDAQTSFTSKMKAHVLTPPPSLKAARSDVPPELEALYQRLMAKEPLQRPESAKRVAEELREMLRSWTKSPGLAETITWPGGAGAKSGAMGKRALAALAAAGVLIAAIVSGVYWGSHKPGDVGSAPLAKDQRQQVEKARLAPAAASAPFNAAQAKYRQEAWAYYLGTPVEWTNSIGMKFCLIPPGEYDRGSDENRVDDTLRKLSKKVKGNVSAEAERDFKSEAPRHRVRILAPFYLSAHEVTQGEYLRVLGTNPAQFTTTVSGKSREKMSGRDHGRLPVESVSFDNAVEFCRRLTEMEASKANQSGGDSLSGGYRLPTDGEWEYACRAGTTSWYCCGGAESEIDRFAWQRKQMPWLVGSLKSNAFGLFDMHGNVWEICEDYFAVDDFASVGKVVDSPTGPATGTSRVARGGGFGSQPILCRSSSRTAFDEPRNNVGFRPAVSVEFVRARVSR